MYLLVNTIAFHSCKLSSGVLISEQLSVTPLEVLLGKDCGADCFYPSVTSDELHKHSVLLMAESGPPSKAILTLANLQL